MTHHLSTEKLGRGQRKNANTQGGPGQNKKLQNRLAAKIPWSKNKKTRSFSHWKPS